MHLPDISFSKKNIHRFCSISRFADLSHKMKQHIYSCSCLTLKAEFLTLSFIFTKTRCNFIWPYNLSNRKLQREKWQVKMCFFSKFNVNKLIFMNMILSHVPNSFVCAWYPQVRQKNIFLIHNYIIFRHNFEWIPIYQSLKTMLAWIK